MKCTVCSYGRLLPSFIEGLFRCYTCDRCNGNLIELSDYLTWRDVHKTDDLTVETGVKIEVCDTVKAIPCPMTGALMTKFRISKDTEHKLDLSRSINVIWMDKGEWELLKEGGLAMSLTDIFTVDWQKGIRIEETKEVFEELYLKRFGDFYQEIKKFKSRLEEVGSKGDVIAYLISDNPYK